jgi:organic radical activating enzyme
MFGENPIRKPLAGDGSVLEIQEIFPTLQGEGPRTGEPSVFVRLGGCNLACSFCDTEFENFDLWDLPELVDEIIRLSEDAPPTGNRRNLVVITGGEPLRQNIIPLCESLLQAGFTVQIETNGTLWRDLPEAVEVVCSPKASQGRYGAIRPDILARARALKFIISKSRKPYDNFPAGLEGYPVWLQPMDEYHPEKNLDNLEHTLKLAEQTGAKISLQTHKLADID